jgi:sugar (pentulose or hexulose) kinase
VSLLGVDVGTTHCKVAVCDLDGSLLRVVRQPTPLSHDHAGLSYYDPEALWLTVAGAIQDIGAQCDLATITCVGVASMAEAGLLVDLRSGEPRTEIIPWYDARTTQQARFIAMADDPIAQFRRTGLHSSFKYGLEKILWLRDRDPDVTDGAAWLSVADYIVYRLTGCMATDPTLAVRTYVYALEDGAWDEVWIRHFGLSPANFPPVMPSGESAGSVHGEASDLTGLPIGTHAAVAGHDHICASLAVGLVHPGTVVDSMGTAESMVGVLDRLELGDEAFQSGLVMAPHVLSNRFCWLGGTRSAGGSVEWIRSMLADVPLSHEDAHRLLAAAGEGPTGLLYFPYLLGSGGLHPDDEVRGAFIGLSASHERGHLLKAVLEGTAFESESVRRAAEHLTSAAIGELTLVGGGASNEWWVQIKADVTGCRCMLPQVDEATALGAALLAGLGCGVLASEEALNAITNGFRAAGRTIYPDPTRHEAYRQVYDHAYAPIGDGLRRLSGGTGLEEGR